MSDRPKVTTCLWFGTQGEEAAKFYVSLIPGSEMGTIFRPAPDGPAMVVNFTLAGTPYMILNGGPHHQLSPAASIAVQTKDQAETDRLWAALIAGGGSEGNCGWLTDRYGVSWQIVPEAMPRLFTADDKAAAARAREAMMSMRKIDIARLEAAFHGH